MDAITKRPMSMIQLLRIESNQILSKFLEKFSEKISREFFVEFRGLYHLKVYNFFAEFHEKFFE